MYIGFNRKKCPIFKYFNENNWIWVELLIFLVVEQNADSSSFHGIIEIKLKIQILKFLEKFLSLIYLEAKELQILLMLIKKLNLMELK